MNKVSIVILDDHKLIREMWSVLFAGNAEFEITGECGTVKEVIDIIKIKRPDIVFLDINLAEESGMDAVPLIRKLSPGTKIIAVTTHKEPAYVKKALQLGAKAYVTKNSSQKEMIEAIDEVMSGGQYICLEVKNIILEQIIGPTSDGSLVKTLSLREIEIVGLLKGGLSSRDISAQLNISIRTVEAHRRNILKKLQLKNTSSMIDFIYKNNYLN